MGVTDVLIRLRSLVLGDFSRRELILMLASDNVKRMMENRFKSNSQLLEEYFSVINVPLATSSRREAHRIVGHFFASLKGERPTHAGAAFYLSKFRGHSQNTRAGYTDVVSAFFLRFFMRLYVGLRGPRKTLGMEPAGEIEGVGKGGRR